MLSLLNDTTVNFDWAVSSMPTGILLAVRSMETSDLNSNYIDYNFEVLSISLTQFTIKTTLCRQYQLIF